ncbi:MAG: ribonuclease H-like domain-containing protein [candidate division WOR-3 bacterium]
MRSFDPDLIDDEPLQDEFSRIDPFHSLLQKSVRRFEGRSPAEVLAGSGQLNRIRNHKGTCWLLQTSRRGSFGRWPREQARADLLNTTSLVYGIRDRTSCQLAAAGFADLNSLTRHPRYGDDARRVCECIRTARTPELAQIIRERLSASHPLHLRLTGLHQDEDFLFLDLETMGLFGGQPVIVAGICRISASNTLELRQFICRDYSDEPALLAAVSREINSSAVLVTFNGRTFDLQFLLQRCAFYGLSLPAAELHLDLLYFCRRAWGDQLPSCRLNVLEQEILGTSRDSDLPGELVPEFYEEWLRTGNPGFLKTIVDHNRQDVISLVNLLTALTDYWTQSSGR